MKVVKNILLNSLVSFVSLLIVLVLAEIGLRIFGNQAMYTLAQYPREMFDYSQPTKLNPGFEGAFPRSELRGRISINSQGLRDYQRSYEKGNVFRILGLGDSFPFGHGVEVEESYLSILEKKLQNYFSDSMEVVKAGIPGTGPQTYYRVMKKEGVRYEPDMVLVSFFVGNDINDITLPREKTIAVNDSASPQAQPAQAAISHEETASITATKDFLRRHVHLYSFVVDRLKANPHIRNFLQEKNIASGLIGSYVIDVLKKDYNDIYERKWLVAYDMLDSIAALSPQTVLVIVPTREQVEDKRRTEALRQLGYDSESIDIYKPNNLLKQYCAQRGILCIDLLDIFRETYKETGQRLYFQIDPHFNAEGHKVAAEKLYKKLIREIGESLEKY